MKKERQILQNPANPDLPECVEIDGILYRKSGSKAAHEDALPSYVPRERYAKQQDELEALKDRIQEVGMAAFVELSRVQRDKLLVVDHLRCKYPDREIEPDGLFRLDPELLEEGKNHLRDFLGRSPNAKQRLDDVFRKPKKSRAFSDHFYRRV